MTDGRFQIADVKNGNMLPGAICIVPTLQRGDAHPERSAFIQSASRRGAAPIAVPTQSVGTITGACIHFSFFPSFHFLKSAI
jgi:hypothetical protein